MKPFPLQTLLRTREHREQRALQEVMELRFALAARMQEAAAVQARLDVVTAEEQRLENWLVEQTTQPGCPVKAFTGIDDRRGLLREQNAAITEELQAANAKVDEARLALAEGIRTYRRARAKKDSAAVQRQHWERREKSLDDRRDENAAEEYTLSRYFLTERSL